MRISLRIITLLSTIVFVDLRCASLLEAQPENSTNIPAEAEERIRDIYERNRYQPRRVQAEWLPDSSGFLGRDLESGAKNTSRNFYDVSTGTSSEPTSEQLASLPESQQVAPNRSWKIETKYRELSLRSLEETSTSGTGKVRTLYKASADRDVRIRETSWSPDGKFVLFLESDMTNVPIRQVLISDDPSYPRLENHRFARVGETIESLRVGFVPAEGGDVTWLDLKTPENGQYLGQIGWAGNSEEILIEKFSRFRDAREVILYRLDGSSTTIYSETSESWLESSQGKISGITWIRNGDAFIVISEKDGWRHAYLHARDGSELAILTPGDYDVIDRAVVDESNQFYYFYASPENGTQKYLYRVPLDGSGELERVTPNEQPGTHQYQFSPNARWAIHTYSTLDFPPVVELVELPSHRVVRVLEENSSLQERMKQVITHPTEFFSLDIGNGFTADSWMIKPRDFDPSNKYPVFIYVYGEPHLQTVLDEWGASQIDFHRAIADLGYLVVSFDNRGTPAPKGAAWRRAVFGSLGPLSTEEQEAALKSLGQRFDFVDLSRVGIWGWSGGGSNTLNAMFRKPDSYHVGIAVVPKPQPHLYNAWFQEIFMRDLKVNPEGYKTAAAINYAEGLKGKLLIVTGSGETNTHIQIIEGLVDRLIELGKPFDYWVYPNRDHGLREGAGTTVHVRLLIIRYLLNNLTPGPRYK